MQLRPNPSGNVYISDNQNHAIRKVTGGTITTVAGNGSAGYGGDHGPATSANLSGPVGIAVDPLGDIYIADSSNQVIRKVDSAGVIVTLAGNGSSGYTGDGGPGLVAQLYSPKFPTIDTTLTLYFSDTSSYVVRSLGSATALNFGNQSMSATTSSALPTELFNASFQPGTIGAISATGDFAVTNAGSCTTGAAFVPEPSARLRNLHADPGRAPNGNVVDRRRHERYSEPSAIRSWTGRPRQHDYGSAFQLNPR